MALTGDRSLSSWSRRIACRCSSNALARQWRAAPGRTTGPPDRQHLTSLHPCSFLGIHMDEPHSKNVLVYVYICIYTLHYTTNYILSLCVCVCVEEAHQALVPFKVKPNSAQRHSPIAAFQKATFFKRSRCSFSPLAQQIVTKSKHPWQPWQPWSKFNLDWLSHEK